MLFKDSDQMASTKGRHGESSFPMGSLARTSMSERPAFLVLSVAVCCAADVNEPGNKNKCEHAELSPSMSYKRQQNHNSDKVWAGF